MLEKPRSGRFMIEDSGIDSGSLSTNEACSSGIDSWTLNPVPPDASGTFGDRAPIHRHQTEFAAQVVRTRGRVNMAWTAARCRIVSTTPEHTARERQLPLPCTPSNSGCIGVSRPCGPWRFRMMCEHRIPDQPHSGYPAPPRSTRTRRHLLRR